MKIGLFGTFDIGNFGDILFPIVAQAMFRKIDPSIDLERYSYRPKSAADWYYDVRPIQALPDRLPDLDLVLVGGGHLLHANRYMAAGYGPTDPAIPHPFGFWWLPVMAAGLGGVPSALHGISIDPSFPEWAAPLLSGFAEVVDYATVRDPASQARLTSWAPHRTVSIIPDSIFSISRVIERGKLSPAAQAFLADHGLDNRPYLIVQPSSGLRTHRPFINQLIGQARKRDWAVLEMPIFAEAHNRVGVYADVPGVTTIKRWPDPLLLAEIIANAAAVAGISLHLSIVASTYGIPVFRPRYSRDSKYILLDGLSNIRFMEDCAPDFGDADNSYAADPKIAGWQKILDQHYQRLIALAEQGQARADRSAKGWDMLVRTPEAFRERRSPQERLDEMKLRARRSRHFLMAQMMPALSSVQSVFRGRKP